MSDIELSPAQRDLLRERLSNCEETFNLELEQFDASFLSTLSPKSWGLCFTTPVLKSHPHPSGMERAHSGRDGFEEGLLTQDGREINKHTQTTWL